MSSLFGDEAVIAAAHPPAAPAFRYNDETPPPIVWDEEMKPNPGFRPEEVRGKRVIVQLANGSICGLEPVTTVSPAGWAADGKERCRWSRARMPDGEPYPFDIERYKVIGPVIEEEEDAAAGDDDKE